MITYNSMKLTLMSNSHSLKESYSGRPQKASLNGTGTASWAKNSIAIRRKMMSATRICIVW